MECIKPFFAFLSIIIITIMINENFTKELKNYSNLTTYLPIDFIQTRIICFG